MIKLQQYQVFKIPTSRLVENNYTISDYIPSKARENGELVQIGDNQVFRMIRKIENVDTNIDKLNELINNRETTKKMESTKENSEKIISLQSQIDDILFVPQIVNVVADDKKAYKHICQNGFLVNGMKMVRFCSGAGQSRRNTASFVDERLKEELDTRLNCGLNIQKINVAKYNAYFGLYMSATYPVRTPRVCLIDDYEECELIKTVDWIEDKETQDRNGKKIVRRVLKEKDDFVFIPNMWDGQGLISPAMAELWQKDLELKYLPSQFGIRSSFIKGMLVTFDFHKYAKEIAEAKTIKDHFGKVWNVEDIDVLLSVSQFKMYKYYDSWEQFIDFQDTYGHSWGITRVNPTHDNEMSLLNYQYIQTLDLSKDDLETLSSPTVEWIKKVCEGDKLYTLLFLSGSNKADDTFEDILDRTGSNFVKAVLYNEKLLKDPYIRKKIYESISSKIRNAKIGRLWVNGNYQAMISDPYGQAQFAFNQEVTGLLPEFKHYSHFWNKRQVKTVDACRSPMVDFHEHNVLSFMKNKETDKWYEYIKSGIIYNVWGVDTIRHSDSDWDYDIVFTTDNETMIKGIVPNQNVITYEKQTAKPEKLTEANKLKTDLRSFDSKVGSITNYSTTFIAMLANFRKGSPQYNELITRIKLLRRYIGDSIDQAKGIKMKPFPTEWKKREYLNEDDSPEEKKEKYYHNSMVADKKPYFMIYIYDKLKNEYKEYNKKSDRACKEKLGISLNDLLSKQNKTPEEKKIVREYYQKMPVIKNKSIMNVLCNMIERIDFEYKKPKNEENAEDMFDVLFDKSIQFDLDKLNELIALYDKFKKKRGFKMRNNALSRTETGKEAEKDKNDAMNKFYDEIRNEAYSICSNTRELANYLVYINYYLFPTEPKDFTWSIGIDGLLEKLSDETETIEVPFPDNNGEDYLGKKYSLRSVVI
ncbi:MAG: hypothetical protein ACI35O_14450 [Bacillaceae bacterium]